MPKTPFQMLLRGQNLVAYRNHPDDLVEAFVEKSAEVGIDIFRCFDAVNDERNFETAFKVIKGWEAYSGDDLLFSDRAEDGGSGLSSELLS